MEILKIKRPKDKSSILKIYGSILGDSGKQYIFSYIRDRVFRGWNCSCDSFLLDKQPKNLNCKHLKFIRQTYGRYGQKLTA